MEELSTMNLFEIVKASVSVPEAARAYGFTMTRHNMTRCPFRDDRHPSLRGQAPKCRAAAGAPIQ